jgi:sulfate adenylyltransferase
VQFDTGGRKLIPEPHGGHLVDRVANDQDRERADRDFDAMPKLRPFVDQLYDLEKIAIGAYSPLEGFMDSATLSTVLAEGRLPNGLPWTLPILLPPGSPADRSVVDALRPGDEVALLGPGDRFLGSLQVEEKFPIDRAAIAQSAFGTTDPRHPNVADLLAGGEVAIAGRVKLYRRLYDASARIEMTPSETRKLFSDRGWKNVAAYQCRNPPHTAHEYLQRLTLEREDVDALFIHPVVGRLKKGDYRPEVIMAAYSALVRDYYPPGRVILSPLSITMRYAGPKAALFLAIVRKNYGCNRYIVGRDQAGVGSYYEPYAAHRIFDQYDIGIVPLRYEESFFCRRCGWMASPKTCVHPAADRIDTSQTRIRKALADGGAIPPELVRPEVAEILRSPDVFLPD